MLETCFSKKLVEHICWLVKNKMCWHVHAYQTGQHINHLSNVIQSKQLAETPLQPVQYHICRVWSNQNDETIGIQLCIKHYHGQNITLACRHYSIHPKYQYVCQIDSPHRSTGRQPHNERPPSKCPTLYAFGLKRGTTWRSQECILV